MGQSCLLFVLVLLLIAQLHDGALAQLPDYVTPYQSNSKVPALFAGDAVFSDLNGDGKMDLIVCGSATTAGATAPVTSVLEQVKLQGFQPASSISLENLGDCAIAVADLNKDNFSEIIMTGAQQCPSGTAATRIYTFTAGKGFSTSPVKTNQLYRGSVNVADLDQDGLPDLVLTGSNLNPCDGTGASPFYFIDILRNDGSLAFTYKADALYSGVPDLPPFASSSVDIGDLDGDGLPDMVACGAAAKDPAAEFVLTVIAYMDKKGDSPVWRIDGSNTVVKSLKDCAVKMLDYDGDGDLDIFITGDNGKTEFCQLLTNQQSAGQKRVFTDETADRGTNITCVNNRPRVLVADFDQDGLPDLVVQGDHHDPITSDVLSDTVLYMNRPISRTQWFWERHFLKNISYGAIASGDFNGDTFPDLYISGRQNPNSSPENQLYVSTVAAAVTSLTASVSAATALESTSISTLAGAGLLTSTTAASQAVSSSAAASQAALTSTGALTSTSTTASLSSTSTASTLAGSTTGAASISTYATTVSSVLAASVSSATTTLSTGEALRPPSLTIHGMPFTNARNDLPDGPQYSGQDTELKLGLTFRVRITKIEEEDENGFAWPQDNPCPTPSAFNASTEFIRGPLGSQGTLLKRYTELCNGAAVELDFVNFADAERLEFAGETFELGFGQIKMTGSVRNWPFRSLSHRLRVQTQVSIVQDTPVLSEQYRDRPPAPFLWQIQAKARVWLEIGLFRNGLVDSAPTALNLSPSNDGPLLFDIRAPAFRRELQWDPKFEALLGGDYPKKKSKKGLKIGIPVAVGVCLLIVLIVGLVFFIKKHSDSKTQTDVPSHRRSVNKPEESSVL